MTHVPTTLTDAGTYVSQLERCVTNISIDGLERIAQALGVDVVDLLVTQLDEGQTD